MLIERRVCRRRFCDVMPICVYVEVYLWISESGGLFIYGLIAVVVAAAADTLEVCFLGRARER